MATLNLTAELERLIADICRRVEEFRHIDPNRVLVCVASTRGSGIHGTYAKIHPLRFAGGAASTTIRRGRRILTCTMPTVFHRGEEMLYIVYFLVPRFLDLPFREKLITVVHELYHVSPAFDGDIRRFPGRNYAHGSSTRKYNAHMAELVDAYLARLEDRSLVAFLEGDMTALRGRHRAIVGRRFPAPKIVTS
ncbi:MAG TPA: putative metallopeptidase [Geobacteraceae bacterium]